MRRGFCVVIALVAAVSTAGCAARSSEMALTKAICPTCTADNKFANSIEVGEVTGSDPNRPQVHFSVDNESLRAAIQKSLASNNLWSSKRGMGAYVLSVQMIEGGYAYGAITVGSDATIRYVLVEKATGKREKDELIETSARFTLSQEPLSVIRAQRAVEMSVKKNITEFVSRLLGGFRPFPVETNSPKAEGKSGATN